MEIQTQAAAHMEKAVFTPKDMFPSRKTAFVAWDTAL